VQSRDFWEYILVQSIELTIEIFSTEAGSEITGNHAVRVEHRDELKDEGRPEQSGDWILREEEGDDALDDVGGVGLAGMDPASDEEHFLFLPIDDAGILIGIFFSVRVIGDGEQRDIDSSECLAQFVGLDVFGLAHRLVDEILQLRVCIGN
jgi:hypothetical protein